MLLCAEPPRQHDRGRAARVRRADYGKLIVYELPRRSRYGPFHDRARIALRTLIFISQQLRL